MSVSRQISAVLAAMAAVLDPVGVFVFHTAGWTDTIFFRERKRTYYLVSVLLTASFQPRYFLVWISLAILGKNCVSLRQVLANSSGAG